MIEALGLMMTAPAWFAMAFAIMFVEPTLSWLVLVPFTGMAALIAGVILWLRNRRKELLLFLASPLASLLLVFASGVFRGEFRGDAAMPILIAFLIAQAAFLCFALYRCREAWRTAGLLAYGFAAYALFSALIAAMAFADQWI